MIYGIGVDIVNILRIKEAMENHEGFIEKMFTKIEIEYFKSKNFRPEFVAGRFAAKEAISKALGTGFRGFSFKDIEIDRNTFGKPIVVLKGKAKQIAEKNGEHQIQVSISHESDTAIAYAILEKI